MRHLYLKSLSCLILSALLLFACQKQYRPGIEASELLPSISTQQSMTATVQGNIYDENGQPAVSAWVTVGKRSVQSDGKGYFRVEKAALNADAALVTVEKAGYFKAFRSFLATSATCQVGIQLTRKSLAGKIESSAGGEAGLSNGAKVLLPANGVVYAGTGLPYQGAVSVYAAYIDPTSADIGRAVPGSFMANNKEDQRVLLSSYGMLAVELENSNGEKLQVAKGQAATITVPIPATLQSGASPSIPLWFVNEKTGLWQEEGTAVRTGNSYVGTVKHFTFWNADKQLAAVKFSATFKMTDGYPLVHAQIRMSSKGAENVSGFVYTDSLGQISELVPSGQSLLVEVLDPCRNTIYAEQLPAVMADTDKGVIQVKGVSEDAFVTVTGSITPCPGKPLDAIAFISFNNLIQYARADASGQFRARFVSCKTNPGKIEIYGIDLASRQRGASAVFNVSAPVTQVGNIAACGMAIDEYIRYDYDGNEYHIFDSLEAVAFRYDSTLANSMPFLNSPPGNWLQVSAKGMGSRGSIAIRTNLGDAPKAGKYTDPVVQLVFLDRYLISQQISAVMNLTSYANKPKEYFEGTFEMQFINESTPQRKQSTLKGSFRIARR
jgi:hypothetical protein